MKRENLLDLTKKYYESTDENVVSVGYGRKIKNGKLTSEKTLQFFVEEKKPANQLDEKDFLPKEVALDEGSKLKTDVCEGKFKFMIQEFQCPSYYDSYPPTNRGRFRPLRGGVSTTNYSDLHGYVGTLGFLAIDSLTGGLVGISNSHVIIQDFFNTSERSVNSPNKSTIVGDFVVQPLPYDIGDGSDPIDEDYYKIGMVKRYVPISTTDYNYVDVALCTIDDPSLIDSESFKIVGLNYDEPMEFATTEEIDSLLEGDNDCFTSGRTSGPRGEGDQKLKVSSLGVVVSIAYEKQGVATTVEMSDAMIFVGVDQDNNILPCVINGGDSGSVVVADFGGVRKIVGLMYGGATNVAVASRIDRIVDAIRITPWDGSLNGLKYSASYNVIYENASTEAGFLYKASQGKTFWQAGLVNASDVVSTSFQVDLSSGQISLNGAPASQVVLNEGETYEFSVNSPGHPLEITQKT